MVYLCTKLTISFSVAINREFLSEKAELSNPVSDNDAFELLSLPLSYLIYTADKIRSRMHPENIVTYIIDRNINITNVCFSFCEFCNFCRKRDEEDAYITSEEQYRRKIGELFEAGGNQVLLQGGMHPDLGLSFYVNLFRKLKAIFPQIYLHALSPSEIVFLSQKENIPVSGILSELIGAGLDSLPGGGAEILVDRVREKLSPAKATSEQWLDVMRQAHLLGLSTTATMMFGHIETQEERIEHILKIRTLQAENPGPGQGFISFIPWTFQSGSTRLAEKFPGEYSISMQEYVKMIAISRILLHNIPNIQASWLTTGKDTATLALHSGANDLGSIMLEENVVASTGVYGKLSVEEMEDLIRRSGFIPARRNQRFEIQ
jgi:cyclic dehypoxanthinyl futalosine synthase